MTGPWHRYGLMQYSPRYDGYSACTCHLVVLLNVAAADSLSRRMGHPKAKRALGVLQLTGLILVESLPPVPLADLAALRAIYISTIRHPPAGPCAVLYRCHKGKAGVVPPAGRSKQQQQGRRPVLELQQKPAAYATEKRCWRQARSPIQCRQH